MSLVLLFLLGVTTLIAAQSTPTLPSSFIGDFTLLFGDYPGEPAFMGTTYFDFKSSSLRMDLEDNPKYNVPYSFQSTFQVSPHKGRSRNEVKFDVIQLLDDNCWYSPVNGSLYIPDSLQLDPSVWSLAGTEIIDGVTCQYWMSTYHVSIYVRPKDSFVMRWSIDSSYGLSNITFSKDAYVGYVAPGNFTFPSDCLNVSPQSVLPLQSVKTPRKEPLSILVEQIGSLVKKAHAVRTQEQPDPPVIAQAFTANVAVNVTGGMLLDLINNVGVFFSLKYFLSGTVAMDTNQGGAAVNLMDDSDHKVPFKLNTLGIQHPNPDGESMAYWLLPKANGRCYCQEFNYFDWVAIYLLGVMPGAEYTGSMTVNGDLCDVWTVQYYFNLFTWVIRRSDNALVIWNLHGLVSLEFSNIKVGPVDPSQFAKPTTTCAVWATNIPCN